VAELERQFNTEKDLQSLNKKLVEKRKTVSVLDTQTEIMIRQIEVLAGYVERAKKTNEPIDPRELEESAIKEFVQKLDKVKQNMAAAIEQLHAERDELLEEKAQAIADRDRALLEFEQLSSKNAQLADMNNDLTHQIQERFKQQINNGDLRMPPNGLGIYGHAKGVSSASVNMDGASLQTGTTLVGPDADEPVVEGPTVVNIRKGQVKKFNWKKGSSKVAHNISKGINRAAGAFQQQEQNRPVQGLSGDNIGLPYNMTVAQVESPVTMGAPGGPNRAATENNTRQGFGFFSKKQANVPKSSSATNVSSSSSPAPAEAPSTLFGSDLVERADYERRQIPSVVTRCIEEVELRGMDIEGIYRKTGGNSLVKSIQEGFEKTEDYDISDPSLDITAVTSVLKQYFRKLPTPLLTFEVYDRILESNGTSPLVLSFLICSVLTGCVFFCCSDTKRDGAVRAPAEDDQHAPAQAPRLPRVPHVPPRPGGEPRAGELGTSLPAPAKRRHVAGCMCVSVCKLTIFPPSSDVPQEPGRRVCAHYHARSQPREGDDGHACEECGGAVLD
jgi:hypothetical protein